jgi:ATP-dependent exoDNAse (exonuclease V) alpha subunit
MCHLLQRNLLYTAVTRGKRLVVIVGQKKAWRSR